jgi:hypothetical protein
MLNPWGLTAGVFPVDQADQEVKLEKQPCSLICSNQEILPEQSSWCIWPVRW